MRETPEDLDQLRKLLDRSHDGGGAHLRAIFDNEHRVTAEDVVATLDGILEIHVATVTGDGAPLVAPIDAIFFRGQLWIGFPAHSVRGRLVRREPRVSASYIQAPSFGLIVHGTAREADAAGPIFAGYEALLRELYGAAYGPGWNEWYDNLHRDDVDHTWFTGWIEPRVMFVRR